MQEKDGYTLPQVQHLVKMVLKVSQILGGEKVCYCLRTLKLLNLESRGNDTMK